MSLIEQYDNGIIEIPLDGYYEVQMCINDKREIILEKKIAGRKGSNHLPIFGLRYFKIPFMDFDIVRTEMELLFIYRNGLVVDKLRKVGNLWLGKLFYKNKFIDYFWLKGNHFRRKSWMRNLI